MAQKPWKHFNQVHVFGCVVKVENPTKQKDKFLVKVELDCKSPVYGGAIAYVDVWNNKGKAAHKWLKGVKPSDVIKFEGRLKEKHYQDKVYYSVDAYKWELRPDADRRFGVVLVGEVLKVVPGDDGEQVVSLAVRRPKKRDSEEMHEDDYTVYWHPEEARGRNLGKYVGKTVSLEVMFCHKGEYREVRDEITGPLRPYIKEVKVNEVDS